VILFYFFVCLFVCLFFGVFVLWLLLRMNKTLFIVALALFAGVAVQASSTIRASKVPSFRWDQFLGKTVLVTGGSSGIGFATALSFARFGSRVIICSRDSNPAWFNGSDAERRINEDPEVQSLGGYARWIKTDVAEPKEVDALIQNIEKLEGTIDYAVNNAGLGGYLGSIFDPEFQKYFGGEHDCIRTNIFGTAQTLAAEVQLWKKQGRGGVAVNTASVDGLHGSDLATMYCTSKHAVIGLTKSVAMELADYKPAIRVNAIAPGFTDTSLVWQQVKFLANHQQSWEGDYITHDHPLWKQLGHLFAETQPAGKICDPMDQARMIMYLCSEEASYIDGAVLVVDGGVNDEGVDM